MDTAWQNKWYNPETFLKLEHILHRVSNHCWFSIVLGCWDGWMVANLKTFANLFFSISKQMFKVNYNNIWVVYWKRWKLTKKILEQGHCSRSDVLLITLSTFYSLILCLNCWFWTWIYLIALKDTWEFGRLVHCTKKVVFCKGFL